MKRLLIIGAGGFGREVYAWARDIQAVSREWEIGGFLDDNPRALDGYDYPVPILGSINEYTSQPGDGVAVALGLPRPKLEVAERLLRRGAELATLIHPTAVIGHGVTIGQGCIICPHAVITCDVTLGRLVTVNLGATIGHDATIGDGCTLSCHADITGYVRLGNGIFLGSHASVLPSAVVGDFAVIGAGSVVLKRVKPGVTVAGVPAKPLT